MKRGLTAACLAMLLAGCATTAGKVDSAAAIASFQAGVTTIAQAEAALGQPYQASHMPDGTQQLQYVNKVEDLAADDMPTTGSQMRKRSTTTVSTMLSFDASGHFVRAWSSSQAQNGNKMPSDLGNMQQGDLSRSAPGG
jgi:PBP1b-binding outer membrane lipoprotein LpoB